MNVFRGLYSAQQLKVGGRECWKRYKEDNPQQIQWKVLSEMKERVIVIRGDTVLRHETS